ncbi:MAG: alkyl sulfatase dimerization domain-containing protein [Actinomycetota bacterium]|nr:alkyl sulfatase dimerization domain-containing protein [Actinomycetota bacterium]
MTTPKPATVHTQQANAPRDLGMDDRDIDRARQGLIAQHPTGVLEGPLGVAWDASRHDYVVDGAQPDTVHPSLWRQAQLNAEHGLFSVADRVWQVRGYDISNITFIEGQTGWIVIDPLTVEPAARAALELANTHLGERPVVAVIYTHSHTDHFGGVLGVTSQEEVDAGRCRIIAPEGFLYEAIAENVIAGFAMGRRAAYQFGPLLPPGPTGHVDCGLGKGLAIAAPSLIAPTEEITFTSEELDIDGVRVVFQLTPEAEAPAEMNFFFPDFGWLCMAENCTHTMHNLVPIRGALVRDALAWSKYIDEAISLFGDETEVFFASHHWPRWGHDDIVDYLRKQRDMYRWIHDQTMRLANHGYTALEIAEELELPEEFSSQGHTTGYYGHLVHNVKAVYQRYLSWYDGNPANLWRLPPTEVGSRYVALAGGADAMVAGAQKSFDEGDYRWVVEMLNHLVFAEPDHAAGRALQADALEQLGYQSESATFRNAYLTGAQELRNGAPPRREAMRRGFLDAMTVSQLLDTIAVRLPSDLVGGRHVTIHLTISDRPTEADWTIEISNRAMSSIAGLRGSSDLALTLPAECLIALAANEMTVDDVLAASRCEGDHTAFEFAFGHLELFYSGFPIVEP